MRLAVISSSAPYGKGESFVITEANALSEEAVDVLLIPTQLRPGNPNRFQLHERVSLLAQPSLSLSVVSAFFSLLIQSPAKVLSLFKLVTDTNIWNTVKNYLVLPKAIWLSKQLKQRNIEHIYAHWMTTSATLAMVISRLTGIPWSCTAHRGDIVTNNLLELKCQDASFVRFISISGVELARARAKLNDSKVKILHMGVSVPPVTEQPKPSLVGASRSLFTILCPANLIPVKGHKYLIEAMSKMKRAEKVRLLLAGDGELREKLETQATKLGVAEKISFLGHVPHNNLITMYENKEVDLVVLPSLDLGNGIHEGIPVSLMEAMSHQVPVISTRTGGIPELLEDSMTGSEFGCLVTAGDSSVLAEEIDNMVGCESFCNYWARSGLTRITENFNLEINTKRLVDLLSDRR
ncbi:glycosyltransferase [uncultured Methylophaga sp.]|uniref:glycosyltransferase n=1 Tax=uncultured Methylophaga sp. TaxID=285271 RepID=UPI00262BCA95|nr:glycosyltransferase [uncultured Methylophaga sp.]